MDGKKGILRQERRCEMHRLFFRMKIDKRLVKTSFLNCRKKHENSLKIKQYVKSVCKLRKIIVKIDTIF